MTKNLSWMLAIAVLIMVMTFNEQGGALDTIAANGEQPATSEESQSDATEPQQVVLASKVASGQEEAQGSAWDWFAEADSAPSPSAVPATRRQVRPRPVQDRPEGALARHRLNIEE